MTRFLAGLISALLFSTAALQAAPAPCPPVAQWELGQRAVYVPCPPQLSALPNFNCNQPCPHSFAFSRPVIGQQENCRLVVVSSGNTFQTFLPAHRNDKGQCVPDIAGVRLPASAAARPPINAVPVAARPIQTGPVQAPPRIAPPRFTPPRFSFPARMQGSPRSVPAASASHGGQITH